MAHIELLFFYDLNLPNWQTLAPEIARKSSDTDIRHGFHSSTPMGPKAVMERLGPLYSNFNLWQDKIKETFDPNAISKPTPTITS
jgi:hypothetical protein